MQNSSAISASTHEPPKGFLRHMRNVLLQKIWLPRAIYETLPYLYFLLGLGALVSAIYTPGWGWILPYAMLFGLVCLHVSIALIALRCNFRQQPQSCRRDDGQT
jgi:hypothetical protein